MNGLRPGEELASLRTAITQTLGAEMLRDPNVLLLGEAGEESSQTMTAGLRDIFGERRVFNLPHGASALVGAAAGLAIGGMVPVLELSPVGGVHRAMYQLAAHVGAFRHRSAGRFPLGITLRVPYGNPARALRSRSGTVEGQLTNLAGLKVVAPATATDAKGLLTEAIRDPDPVVFLESIRAYDAISGPVPTGEHRVPFGRARWAVAGSDITVIAWGYQVEVASTVARRLNAQGLSVGVLDLRSLVPLDVGGIVDAVERTGRVLVVEESVSTSGFGAEVIATINEHAFFSLEAPPMRVAAPDTPGATHLLEDAFTPDARIETAVRRLLEVRA